MKNLNIKQKAALFDALFNQEKLDVVTIEELGNPNYQHINIKMWTNHLDSGTASSIERTNISKSVLMQYLTTHLNSL